MAERVDETPRTSEQKKCAHGSCDCQAAPGSKYCSAYCQGAGDTVEIGCGCGHPQCR